MYFCARSGLNLTLALWGWSNPQVKALHVFLRWSILDIAVANLKSVLSVRGSELHLIKIACNQLAHGAAKQGKKHGFILPHHLRFIQDTIGAVHSAVSQVYDKRSPFPPILNLNNEDVSSRPYPLFDRFMDKIDTSKFEGNAKLPPIIRPVELSLVPDTVDTIEEAAVALRHCHNLCVLLENQSKHMKNTFTLRISLIQHLFLNCLPLPLPLNHSHKGQCMWSQKMRYETQMDLIRSVAMIARHFAACSFSVPLTRAFDANRILVMAAVACITDQLMRVVACDTPSQFSLHYSGQAGGPSFPFGFDIGFFEVQSSLMEFYDPQLSLARTQILDYFYELSEIVHKDYFLFEFETKSGLGNESKLLQQLCFELGYENNNGTLPYFLCSNASSMLDYFPELLYFRDIVFMFKFMLTPQVDVFPEIRAWRSIDAKLLWTYNPRTAKTKKGVPTGFIVKAFRKQLKCFPSNAAREELRKKKKEGKELFGGLFAALSAYLAPKVTRTAKTSTDPSILAGTEIRNEDDVLYTRVLPSFNGRLSQKNSELLLSYLTVPYLRIPLMLNFFATEGRLTSLASPKLRAVLDGVLFEPGHWRSNRQLDVPDEIPAPDRAHLATPCGLLMNELMVSPEGICKSFFDMLDLALDLDTGRFTESTASVILYVVRLLVRVEAYLIAICEHHHADGDRVSGTGAQSFVRGLFCPYPKVIDLLTRVRTEIRAALDKRVQPMLEEWCSHTTKKSKMAISCRIHAHMCYMYKNHRVKDLTSESISIFLSSQVFLSTRYRYTVDLKQGVTSLSRAENKAKAGKSLMNRPEWDLERGLGIPQTEMVRISLVYIHMCCV
jgi:hypothetical protein